MLDTCVIVSIDIDGLIPCGLVGMYTYTPEPAITNCQKCHNRHQRVDVNDRIVKSDP